MATYATDHHCVVCSKLLSPHEYEIPSVFNKRITCNRICGGISHSRTALAARGLRADRSCKTCGKKLVRRMKADGVHWSETLSQFCKRNHCDSICGDVSSGKSREIDFALYPERRCLICNKRLIPAISSITGRREPYSTFVNRKYCDEVCYGESVHLRKVKLLAEQGKTLQRFECQFPYVDCVAYGPYTVKGTVMLAISVYDRKTKARFGMAYARYLAEVTLKRKLTNLEHVRHLDGNARNNDYDNLVVVLPHGVIRLVTYLNQEKAHNVSFTNFAITELDLMRQLGAYDMFSRMVTL